MRYWFIIFLFCTFSIQSQNWPSLGLDGNVYCLTVDSSSNLLYVGGTFGTVGTMTTANGFGIWNGTSWDTLPNKFNGNVGSIAAYKNKIYFTGVFNPNPFSCPRFNLMAWDGTNWNGVGIGLWKNQTETGGASMKVINNELYFYGAFDSVLNLSVNSIVKFDGTNWTSLNFPVKNEVINGLAYFKGELYAFGQFINLNGDPNIDYLIKYNGSSWVSVPGANFSGANSIETIAVYKNELYVAGYFLKSNGCLGDNIVKFDGVGWHEVNGGFSYKGFPPAPVRDMKVFNDTLYIAGTFDKMGTMQAHSLVSYDGVKFCAIDNSMEKFPNRLAFYKNRLYLAGTWFASGPSAQDTTRFLGIQNKFTVDTCQTFAIGLNKYSLDNSLKVYPNPVSNTLHIESEEYFAAGTEIEITNTLGQKILKLSYQREIDVSSLASGCYVLKLITSDKHQHYSKFIKQ